MFYSSQTNKEQLLFCLNRGGFGLSQWYKKFYVYEKIFKVVLRANKCPTNTHLKNTRNTLSANWNIFRKLWQSQVHFLGDSTKVMGSTYSEKLFIHPFVWKHAVSTWNGNKVTGHLPVHKWQLWQKTHIPHHVIWFSIRTNFVTIVLSLGVKIWVQTEVVTSEMSCSLKKLTLWKNSGMFSTCLKREK